MRNGNKIQGGTSSTRYPDGNNKLAVPHPQHPHTHTHTNATNSMTTLRTDLTMVLGISLGAHGNRHRHAK